MGHACGCACDGSFTRDAFAITAELLGETTRNDIIWATRPQGSGRREKFVDVCCCHYWVENERNNFSLVRKCCCYLITLQSPCTSVGAQPPRILDKGYHSATGLPKTSHHDTTRILKMDTDRICRDRTAEP